MRPPACIVKAGSLPALHDAPNRRTGGAEKRSQLREATIEN